MSGIGIVRLDANNEAYDWRCENCVDFVPAWDAEGMGGDRSAFSNETDTACTYCGKSIYTHIGTVVEPMPVAENIEILDVADYRVMLTAAEVVKIVMALDDVSDSWQEMAAFAAKRETIAVSFGGSRMRRVRCPTASMP